MKVLETQRLSLETLDGTMFSQLAVLLANPIVHRHFPKALDEAEAKAFLTEVQKRYENDGYAFWAVIRKDDKRFLGICGLLKQVIDGRDEVEVGYRIDNAFWGNGYGTEAAAGCVQYAKDIVKVQSVISLILSENKQSIRVAEKNGLHFDKETIFHGKMHRVYRRNFVEMVLL